jgi:hypothetical protein
MAHIWVVAENRAFTYCAIFEVNDDVGWFYLAIVRDDETSGIVLSLQVVREPPDFSESDVAVVWNDSGDRVELLIRGQLFGYFDLVEMRGVPGHYPDRPLKRNLQ